MHRLLGCILVLVCVGYLAPTHAQSQDFNRGEVSGWCKDAVYNGNLKPPGRFISDGQMVADCIKLLTLLNLQNVTARWQFIDDKSRVDPYIYTRPRWRAVVDHVGKDLDLANPTIQNIQSPDMHDIDAIRYLFEVLVEPQYIAGRTQRDYAKPDMILVAQSLCREYIDANGNRIKQSQQQHPNVTPDCYGHSDYLPTPLSLLDPQFIAEITSAVDAPLRITVDVSEGVVAAIADWAVNLLILMAVLSIFVTAFKVMFGGDSIDPTKILIPLASMIIITSVFGLLLTSPGGEGDNANQPRVFGLATAVSNWISANLVTDVCTEAVEAAGPRGTNTSQWCVNNQVSESTILPAPGGVTPGKVFTIGISRGVALLEQGYAKARAGGGGSFLTVNPFILIGIGIVLFLTVLGTMAVVILWLFLAIYIFAVWVEGFLCMALGVFMLGFGAWDMTRDKALAYMWYVFGWFIRLAFTVIVMFLMIIIFEATVSSVGVALTTHGPNATSSGANASYLNLIEMVIVIVLALLEPWIAMTVIKGLTQTIGGWLGSQSNAAETIGSTMSTMMTNELSKTKSVATAGATAMTLAPAVGSALMGGAAIKGTAAAVETLRGGGSAADALRAFGKGGQQSLGNAANAVNKMKGKLGGKGGP